MAKQDGDTIEFAPVALTTLVDSPVISGRYYRAIQLTPGQTPSARNGYRGGQRRGAGDDSGDASCSCTTW